MLTELIASIWHQVRLDDIMMHLEHLTELDRYQASLGMERAAERIASTAKSLGVEDVKVECFTADGATSWWTFQAPTAWTPMVAQLEIRTNSGCVVAVDHAVQPCTIATYSAPTPAGGLVTRVADLRGDVSGALVVVGAAEFSPQRIASLTARRAAGFVTDALSRDEFPGRIELAADTPLFGFSVTSVQRRAIEAAVGAGAQALIRVDVDRSARMPVVTGRLPGRSNDELWLTAHLCHPRPGANDNASGAAALLGVAATLVDRLTARRRDFERSVRFVWGPEFVGVAALLHQRYGSSGRGGRPAAVINLDMVGEDPIQCGVPLVVERTPEWCPSVITPLAEYVVESVYDRSDAHPGTWRTGPFLGYSDHALFANFADSTWRTPAIQLWHPSDPFNHSAGDSVDKVSPVQMRRATTIGCVLSEVLAAGVVWSREMLDRAVDRWCARELALATVASEQHRDVDGGTWSRRLFDHVRAHNQLLRTLADDGPIAYRCPTIAAPKFVGRWSGPFNYRGLLAALPSQRATEIRELFAADKRNYAVLTHIAMMAEICEGCESTADAAALALRAPIDRAAAQQLWTALLESGWLAEARS